MQKLNLPLVAIALISSLTAGCFGGGLVSMRECESSVPLCDSKFTKRDWGPALQWIPNPLPSKSEFIQLWGPPAETIVESEEVVTLVYRNTDVWCGAVPMWLFAVPLVAPACESFERITFKGEKATHLHFKRPSTKGLVVTPWFVYGSGEKDCPKPCPPGFIERWEQRKASGSLPSHSQGIADPCETDDECSEGLFCYRLSGSCQKLNRGSR